MEVFMEGEVNKHKRVLYIYPHIQQQQAGGDRVNIRNLELLKNSGFSIDTYEIKPLKANKVKTLWRLFCGYTYGINRDVIKEIISVIGNGHVDYLFLSSSIYGLLAKIITDRFPEIKVIVFFHNIEQQYYQELLKTSPTFKNKLISQAAKINELHAIAYGDYYITMNLRDDRLLRDYYGKESNLILPLGFTDTYSRQADKSRFDGLTGKTKLLFVGSAFFANVNGVRWFIDNVYPHLKNVEFKIVGKNMDCHFSPSYNPSNNSSIEVMGYVDDLTPVYENAHVVVSPIFDGGGMKTKTAEAMMYGCPIIGTDEAFEGYDVEYDTIGARCNTADEFISSIERLSSSEGELLNKANNARNYFMRSLETNALVNRFQSFMSNL